MKGADARALAALFADYNSRFFASRLPRYKIRVCRERIGRARANGWIKRNRLEILLWNGESTRLVAGTLLHEMAHASTTDSHGSRFRAEIRRLAKLGAPLEPEEVVCMTNPPERLNRALVEGAAEDVLSERPTVTLRGFVRWFVYEYTGMTGSELLRKYPWVRVAFQRVRKRRSETNGGKGRQ